ncbi:D-Ala-D-Ala dipeptidase vanX. Metallo peptidase. MEROPS family M15D [Salegentibacter echinorum]|uniref:D-alanyl-D-alanine dipeptidase n=1 Tax=Salegentibacter echinorum TaxID=1073325 RepID=A0A1M5LDS4_SALEC|nr:M15 family metallopeptidase [Salegentibacter echinorum]SHG63178.1 D-Ala-D-Ala dipeptidase vanX. Metallo peptidase. MEROPS family M15D [Salegentibacter echinorum]
MKFKLFFLLLLLAFGITAQEQVMPRDFVYVKEVIPDIVLEIRYAGENNFTGKPVNGYNKPVAILNKPTAKALAAVQEDLMEEGYCLKIFDAYRPQRAVNSFIAWSREPGDTIAKQDFYPNLQKKNLFNLGYIATKSGHSRGSTVDLTIIDAHTHKEMDMGGTYDFFGKISHHNTEDISKKQKANRAFLKRLMMKNGFRPYAEEWWHYTLRNEPYPNSYFDFPVE